MYTETAAGLRTCCTALRALADELPRNVRAASEEHPGTLSEPHAGLSDPLTRYVRAFTDTHHCFPVVHSDPEHTNEQDENDAKNDETRGATHDATRNGTQDASQEDGTTRGSFIEEHPGVDEDLHRAVDQLLTLGAVWADHLDTYPDTSHHCEASLAEFLDLMNLAGDLVLTRILDVAHVHS